MRRHFRGNGGLFLRFSEVVSFSLGLSCLKEEQLSAIKAVYEGRA